MSQALTAAPVPVAIGLGSNLGERALTLTTALCRLQQSGALRELRASRFLANSPWDCPPDAPDFFNAAAIGLTDLGPRALLAELQRLERAAGRPAAHAYHASRTLDLDLLLYGNLELTDPDFTVPHPGLRDRRFVLAPLAEVAPDWTVPPTFATVRELLVALD